MTTTFRVANGDVVLDARTGRPQLVADRVKLSQDLRENFDLDKQANGFGAGLGGLVGLVGDALALRIEIDVRVRESIEAIRALQRTYHRAERPAAERIAKVAQVVVARIVPPGNIDPAKTAYGYRVDVLTEAASEPVVSGGAIIG